MGAKVAFGVAIIFTIIGNIFLIVSVASNGWILGCSDGSIKHSNDDVERSSLSQHYVSNDGRGDLYFGFPKGLQICLNKGIVNFGMGVAGMELNIPMKMHVIPVGMIIGSIGIIVAILCSAPAAIALITSVASSSDSYKGKGSALKRARVGVILLVTAGGMGMAGMIACTFETVRDVNNLSRIANQMERAMMIENKIAPGFKSGDIETKVAEATQWLYAFFDIHVGHSIILGWAAVILLIISIILSVAGKKILSSQPYTDLDAKENLLSQPYTVHEGSV